MCACRPQSRPRDKARVTRATNAMLGLRLRFYACLRSGAMPCLPCTRVHTITFLCEIIHFNVVDEEADDDMTYDDIRSADQSALSTHPRARRP